MLFRNTSFIASFFFLTSGVFAQVAEDTIKRIQSSEVEILSTPVREETRRYPAATSIVPRAQFEESRGYELKDALWAVPGVFTQSRSGHSDLRITIRGFGSRGAADRSNAGNMRGVRVLVDGIPETEPDGRTSLDIVDVNALGRVEVFRGNASALYGTASGGVISLFSGAGSEPLLSSKNTFGSFGFLKNSLTGNAAFGNGTFFVTASNTTYDGYRAHSQSREGNLSMVFNTLLGDRTTLRAIAAGSTNIFRFPGPLTWNQFQTDPLQADSAYTARDEHRFNRVGRFGLTLNHMLNDEQEVEGTVYLQPKVLTRSERNSWREFNRYTIGSNAHYAWKKDFGTVKNSLVAGIDQQYQDGTIQFFRLGPNASRSNTLFSNKKESAGVVGLFGQEELQYGDFLFLLGGRYDMIRYESEDLMLAERSQVKEFDHFSPKLGISYTLTPTNTLFVSFGQGVEAPAFNEIDPPDSATIVSHGGTYVAGAAFNPLLELATSTTIELGWRGETTMTGFLRNVRYDVTLFNINVNNDIIPWNGGAFYFTAGETKRQGLELSAQLAMDYGLSLGAAITAMSSEYVTYENQLGTFNGNEVAGVPGLIANGRLRYDSPFDLFVQLETEHVGEYYADDRNDKLPTGEPDPNTNSLVPSYTLFNALVGYKTDFGKLGVDVYAGLRNLADEKYISSAFINGANGKYFEPGMPRNVVGGLNIQYHFNR